MHSIYQRFNNLSALLSSCALALLGAIAISSFFLGADPKGTLGVGNIKVFPGSNRHFRQKNHEYSFMRFNISADLTPLFNWNTKQLFLYVGAEYESADGTKNDVVIWDRIVRRKQDAFINTEAKSKYPLRDMAKTFSGVSPVNYTLKYNVMPYVGVLTYGEAARTNKPIAIPPSNKIVF